MDALRSDRKGVDILPWPLHSSHPRRPWLLHTTGYSLSVDVLSLSEMPWQGTSVLVSIRNPGLVVWEPLSFFSRIGTGSNGAFIILLSTGSCWLPLLASAILGICLKWLGHQMDWAIFNIYWQMQAQISDASGCWIFKVSPEAFHWNKPSSSSKCEHKLAYNVIGAI